VDINENGEILSFIEKGQSGGGLINGGVYVFNREIVDIIPPGKVSLEKEVLPLLVKKGLYGLAAKGYFTDIGIPQDYSSLHNNPEMLLNAIGR
jgi:NDP-sugar pyrophosphorylase family protein